MGNGLKYPMPSEIKNRSIARKSLIANKYIKQGEIYNADNLTIKRPNRYKSNVFLGICWRTC